MWDLRDLLHVVNRIYMTFSLPVYYDIFGNTEVYSEEEQGNKVLWIIMHSSFEEMLAYPFVCQANEYFKRISVCESFIFLKT